MNETTVHKDSNNKSAVDLEIESLQATETSLKQSIATRQGQPSLSARALARERLALKQVQDRLEAISPKTTKAK